MKLWQKNESSNSRVDLFTVGNDRVFDVMLAPFDVLGNMAHAKMLASIGLLSPQEADALCVSLKKIYNNNQNFIE